MIITICSSVDFSEKIIEVKSLLEEKNHIVNIPYITQKIIDSEITLKEFMRNKETDGGDINIRKGYSIDMIKRYWDYIKDSDAILVLNLNKKGIENYIGGNVLMEIGFAYGFKKRIFFYNPIPARSERIHYVDELIDMDPIIINGDLNKII